MNGSPHGSKNQDFGIIYLTLATLLGKKASTMQTIRMCDALARSGCKVYLLTPVNLKSLTTYYSKIREFYATTATFTLIPLIPPLIWTRSKKLNVIIHLSVSSLYVIACSILAKILKKLASQDVFIFIRTPLLLALLQVLRPLNKRTMIVYECHDDIKYEISTLGKLKPFFMRGLENASLIVCTTKFLTRQVKNLIRSEKPVITLYNSYDERIFTRPIGDAQVLKSKLELPRDKYIVAYVGQLWAWKRPEFIIDAFRFVKDDDIVLLFVGGSKQDVLRLKEYSKKRKIKNVIFKGFVRPSVVPKYLKAADCLIHYTPSTGLLRSYSPLKIFEYMAVGKPILAPRQPWIEEVLKDGENALLFDEKSPRDLAEKIMLLKNDKELANYICRKAKLESLKYTYEKRAEMLVEALKGLLKDFVIRT